jgi:sugar phosphate isomerase/epimerase
MFFGYNTNGFAHHRLEDALAVLARLGYEGVGLTLDHHALNPFDPHPSDQVRVVRDLLHRHRLRAVIETGARFLLDARRKHQPTLIDPDPVLREYRREFLRRAARIAAALGVGVVSFWSGTPVDDAPPAVLMERLTESCAILAQDAELLQDVRLAFEPEPGMFLDTMDRYAELFERVNHPRFGLTLDVGHLHCLNEPIGPTIRRWKHVLWNVHIEDMRRGVHEHLMFGEGEIDFGEVVAALKDVDYQGGVFVELSRHSHDAVETARKALAFLRSAHRVGCPSEPEA